MNTATTWPAARTNVPDTDVKGGRIVGFRIKPGDPQFGNGLSGPLVWLNDMCATQPAAGAISHAQVLAAATAFAREATDKPFNELSEMLQAHWLTASLEAIAAVDAVRAQEATR